MRISLNYFGFVYSSLPFIIGLFITFLLRCFTLKSKKIARRYSQRKKTQYCQKKKYNTITLRVLQLFKEYHSEVP